MWLRVRLLIFPVILSLLLEVKGVPVNKNAPSDLQICYRDDPALNDCLMSSIQSLLPKLKNGLPRFDLPSMDPYVIEDAKLNYSVIEAFMGRLSVNQVYSHGLSGGEVLSVVVNITSKNVMRLAIDLWFPEGAIIGNYEGLTRVGLLPFESGGPFNVTLKDAVLSWRIKGKVKKVNGVEYMKVRSFKFKPIEIGHMKVHADGLFPSQQLTKSAVQMINSSWEFFTRQLMPETQNFFGPELVRICNKIFMRIPYDQLLPKGFKEKVKEEEVVKKGENGDKEKDGKEVKKD